MNENAFWGAALLAMVGLLVWTIYMLSGPWAPPCDGDKTGPQVFHGQQIQCFHGDVVKVRP